MLAFFIFYLLQSRLKCHAERGENLFPYRWWTEGEGRVERGRWGEREEGGGLLLPLHNEWGEKPHICLWGFIHFILLFFRALEHGAFTPTNLSYCTWGGHCRPITTSHIHNSNRNPGPSNKPWNTRLRLEILSYFLSATWWMNNTYRTHLTQRMCLPDSCVTADMHVYVHAPKMYLCFIVCVFMHLCQYKWRNDRWPHYKDRNVKLNWAIGGVVRGGGGQRQEARSDEYITAALSLPISPPTHTNTHVCDCN